MKNLVKIIAIILCLIPLVGFGICGVLGVSEGFRSISTGTNSNFGLFIGLGTLGLAIALAFGVLVWKLTKSIVNEE